MRFAIIKAVSVATLLLIAAAVMPRTAEAQARGTLQATATVVDTRTSFASLAAARGAVQSAVAPRAMAQPIDATVAQVSVQHLPAQSRPAALVVTIDYSRN